MHCIYPNKIPGVKSRIIAHLVCSDFFPAKAAQLASLLHLLADKQLTLHTQRLPDPTDNGIRCGSSVELQNLVTGQRSWLQLVYPAQANWRQGRLSLLSPLGAALLGKNSEDIVHLTLLRQQLKFQVLTVLNVKHSSQGES